MPDKYNEDNTYPPHNQTDKSNNANKPWRKFEMYGKQYLAKSFLYIPEKENDTILLF